MSKNRSALRWGEGDRILLHIGSERKTKNAEACTVTLYECGRDNSECRGRHRVRWDVVQQQRVQNLHGTEAGCDTLPRRDVQTIVDGRIFLIIHWLVEWSA